MTGPRFRIHPAIGIARVGNAKVPADGDSSEGFFIGPETPGVPANWDFAAGRCSTFKDEAGKVKRQAARFRIWEYAEQDGRMVPQREITPDGDVESITWKVEVANTKASFYTFREEKGSADRFDGDHPLRNKTVVNDRRHRLEIHPEAGRITGKYAKPVDLVDRKTMAPINTLGQLRTDKSGRLVFLGGTGAAAGPPGGSMPDAYNNSGWFDDVSDGPVSATIKLRGYTETFTAQEAWVIVGPPDFAPAIRSVVTLYDLLVDMTVRELAIPPGDGLYTEYKEGHGLHRLARLKEAWSASKTLSGYQPSYAKDILPIFLRAAAMRWVHDSGYSFHEWMAADHLKSFGERGDDKDPHRNDIRQRIFSWLRDPNEHTVRPWLMPRVFADEYDVRDKPSRYLSLTRTQHALMKRWADGEFQADYDRHIAMPSKPDISPEGLDRAALESCSGGGFCPGMEVGWLIRKREVYSGPFRIMGGARVDALTVGPGFFSQQIALPWHADFWECQKEEDTEAAGVYQAWWPASRPDDVRKAGREEILEWRRTIDTKEDMAKEWSSRGFVIEAGAGFYEEEGPPG